MLNRIHLLLKDPNPNDPHVPEITQVGINPVNDILVIDMLLVQEFKTNRARFEANAKDWTIR